MKRFSGGAGPGPQDGQNWYLGGSPVGGGGVAGMQQQREQGGVYGGGQIHQPGGVGRPFDPPSGRGPMPLPPVEPGPGQAHAGGGQPKYDRSLMLPPTLEAGAAPSGVGGPQYFPVGFQGMDAAQAMGHPGVQGMHMQAGHPSPPQYQVQGGYSHGMASQAPANQSPGLGKGGGTGKRKRGGGAVGEPKPQVPPGIDNAPDGEADPLTGLGGPGGIPFGKGPTAHQDALMELARENLLLKHQLHVATSEMSRLSSVLNGYENQQEKEARPKGQQQKQARSRYWTDEEHQRFLEAVQNFGHKDVKAIASVVGTRSATQVRTHAQKYFMKIARFSGGDTDSASGINDVSTPSNAEDDTCTGTAAAAAAAAGEAGTSAAAAAAFVAASHCKGASGSKPGHKGGIPNESGSPADPPAAAKGKGAVAASAKVAGGGSSSPDGMDDGSSDGTSNGRPTSSNDATNGGTSSNNSNGGRDGNEGSGSDEGRGDSNNGVSSNEGSDHGFFDTGAEEEEGAFVDDLPFQEGGDSEGKTGFEFAEASVA